MEKRGLGRGLGALLPGTSVGTPTEVPINRVQPNPYQPRQVFDEERLAELVESIRAHGVLQPVLVRQSGVDGYELIAGERRLRAAKLAGLRTIPVLVKEYESAQLLEVALIENLQREDINPVEAAHAYHRLRVEFSLTQEEIARRVGKAQSTVANTLRLLALPEPILDSLQKGEITEGHARALLQAAPQAQVTAWQDLVRRGLSVRETERLCRELREGPKREPVEREEPRVTPDPNLAAVEERLQTVLGTKVRIRRSGGAGRMEIEFYSDEHLEALVERILGEE